MNWDFPNNYLLEVSYDGSEYHGWAIQKEQRTVQGDFKVALENFLQEYRWSVAGRTDSGVHARGQRVSLSMPIPFDAEKLMKLLNRMLPLTVRVKNVKKTERYIDIRREAKSRHYKYRIKDQSDLTPFNSRYFTFRDLSSIDWEKVKKGVEKLRGEHNFFNFSSKKKFASNFVRIVDRFELEMKDGIADFSIECASFLYNMVRRIIGTLLYVGEG